MLAFSFGNCAQKYTSYLIETFPHMHQRLFFQGGAFSTNPFHLRLDHLVIDQARVANPLPISTYTDEDFVGKVKRLCILAHPQNMSYQILQRYAAYTCVRWLRQLTG